MITNLLLQRWKPNTGFVLALMLAYSGLGLAAKADQPPASPAATVSSQEPVLKIGGAVPKPIELKLPDLTRMPRIDLRMTDRNGRDVTYSGVSLAEILRAAGLKLDASSMPSRDIVGSYVLVEAADGYRAVFALAEIDPAETNRIVLLADRKDGQPLSANEGPFRIVFPGENHPARWVRQVQSIVVGSP